MRTHPTKAEAALWRLLEPLGFWSQVLISGYIVDFYHQPSRLIVEVDGTSHRGREDYDRKRSAILQKRPGTSVIRFSNAQVLKAPNLVIGHIRKHL